MCVCNWPCVSVIGHVCQCMKECGHDMVKQAFLLTFLMCLDFVLERWHSSCFLFFFSPPPPPPPCFCFLLLYGWKKKRTKKQTNDTPVRALVWWSAWVGGTHLPRGKKLSKTSKPWNHPKLSFDQFCNNKSMTPCQTTSPITLTGAATSVIFVTTKVLLQLTHVYFMCLSWQNTFKHVFAMTKHVFCCDKSTLVATKLLSQQISVATNTCLYKSMRVSWQNYICHDKHVFVTTKVLCRNKHIFVMTKDVFCCDNHMFVATKVCVRHDKIMFVATKIFCGGI